jgi:hypothetical protein
MADSFLFAWKQGVRGQVIEMLPVWNFDPKAWLAARLLWNPQASPDDLIEGFCRDMFGPAAPAMRQYFAMLEDAWMAQPLPVRSTSSSESQYGIIQPRLNDLDARLKDALGQASTPLEKRRVQFFADGLRTTALFIQSYETVRRLNPFPATPVEVFSALEGVAELRRSEDAAAAHLRALKEQCGIGPEVIAPRDRAPLIKAVLDRCVRRLAAQGFVREAEALKAGDLEAVLKARPALAAAGRLKETPPAKPGPEAVLIEEVRTPAVGEAKLLLHEPFESAADVEAHGGVIDGDADFVEGIRGRAAYLNGPFSCVLFPNDRLNPSAGTIEFALKTRWAGRDEEFSHMLFGTQGNLDPPGHVSISISGPAGKRVLSTTVYYTTGSFYSRIPLTDWREDTWHHVAAVWRIDPTDPAKTFVRTYLDGQPSTDRPAGKAGEIRLAGTQFGVGNRPIQAGARAYPMIVVDELRIYDRPLSPEGFSFRKAKRPAAD